MNFVRIKSIYDQNTIAFPSWFILYKHIKAGCIPPQKAIAEIGLSPFSARPFLKFIAKLYTPGSGLTFRGWSYPTTAIIFDPTALPSIADSNSLVYLDTRCGVTLVDKVWFAKKLPSQKISVMPMPLKLKGIGTSKYKSREFAFTTIYILGIDKQGRKVYAFISCKLHLVDRLKTNMLVGNSVLYTKSFAINFSTSPTLIHSCGVRIDVSARQHSKFLRQIVLARGPTLMPPQLETLIAFQHIYLSNTCDFLFHLFLQ